MACEIKNGKYFAPNGKESNLYKELKTIVGEEKAKDLFVLAPLWVVAFTVIIVLTLVGRKKSMCVAAKGRLQGRAATLLLLCGGIFHIFFFVFMQQKFHCHCVGVFFSACL